MAAPRSLLVGAGGQVGTQMLQLLGPVKALPTSREARSGWLVLDLSLLSKITEVERLLDAESLDAIYCIAGMTNVEACEEEPGLAYAVNARGPAILAEYARSCGVPFVYGVRL